MIRLSMILSALTLSLVLMTSMAFAEGSAQNTAQGSANVAQGSAQAGSGAVQGASAVVAVPLKASGAVGQASGKVGEDLLKNAVGEPLPITEETITAGPAPDQAMQ